MSRSLRAVAAAERPAAKKNPPTMAEAVASGNYLQILLAQRRHMVASLPDVKGAPLAALHRQLRDISKEIQTIEFAAADGSDGSVVAVTADEKLDGATV